VALDVLPTGAEAAVTFSEVAWMGTVTSVNHEWIELHNDAAAVDVSGWTITDGANLNISLAGLIPGESYAVLERTTDDAVEGTAFFLYTGALVNTGATLQLLRADGSIEDQVSGGEDWQNIGGDNETKETAQYTSSGWVTAAATPGRAVTAAEVTVAAADDDEPVVRTTSGGGPLQKPSKSEPVVLTLPGVTLQLVPMAQKLVYVHQTIAFTVEASGVGETIIDSLQYEWNFGDGTIASGKEPTHVYEYPGTYVVTVYGGYKRQEQVARHEITVLPVTMSLTTNEQGDIQVNNDSPYELDLSGYRLAGAKTFTFPARSIILPNQTITLSRRVLGDQGERMVILYDTEAAAVASLLPRGFLAVREEVLDNSPTPMISALSYSPTPAPALPSESDFGFSPVSTDLSEAESGTTTSLVMTEPILDNEQLATVGAAPLTANVRWPYLALAAVLFIATVGLLAAPRRNEKA
jgi:hypothetical protein